MERKYKLRILRLMSIYSLIMLALVLYALSLFKSNSPYERQAQESNDIIVQTEYVYIKVEESNIAESETTAMSEGIMKYTVKEYMEKIGVFSEDGTLVRSIDVYVKTLPEADRRLLREGIEIMGKQALDELIQDYDG